MTTLVIDSNFLAYRAYYSMTGMSHDDLETGVLFGFLSSVLELGHQFKTNRFIFCWDSKHSHRKKLFPEYKANRAVTDPEELERKKTFYRQCKVLRLWATPAISKNTYLVSGYEADDLIMASCWFEPGGRVVTIASDEDLYQVLQLRHNEWYNPIKPLLMTYDRFVKHYGIQPKEWAMVKAMAGDTSDNIKGIKGIGKVNAIKYIRDELGAETEAFKKIREAIDNSTELELYRDLIKLPFNCNHSTIHPDLSGCARQEFPPQTINNLIPVFEEFGMDSFLEGVQLRRWEKLFAGDFTPEPSRVRFKKRGRR